MRDVSHKVSLHSQSVLNFLIRFLKPDKHLVKSTVLRHYLVPDEHGNNNDRYSLTSLYYDSPDYRCYEEKMAGIKFRRKVRLRRYETGKVFTAETPVYLEIKQRFDRVTKSGGQRSLIGKLCA